MTDHESNWDTLVEVSPAETRIAVVDGDGMLRRFRIERQNAKSPVHALYRAKVTKIEKATGGAFFDLGDPVLGDVFLPKIPKAMTEGQSALVQVIRPPDGNKGAAITTRPVLKGRYCTYYPTGGSGTVDRRCGQGKRRAELEQALGNLMPKTGGLMINCAAMAAPEKAIADEVNDLCSEWRAISNAYEKADRPGILQPAPDALQLTLLEAPPEGRIAIDDRRVHAASKSAVDARWPDLKDGLLFHDPRIPIYNAAGLESEIDGLAERISPVPGGGSLSIDRVEAMTVIDVNLADTKIAPDGYSGTVKLNLRAAEEAARQIELRNLSGLIVIDFVSMRNKEDRKKVVDATRKALRNATVPTDVLGITAAGLVEITRQRNGPSLADQLLAPALAAVAHPSAEAAAILRKLTHSLGAGRPVVSASEKVISVIKSDFADALRETELRIGQAIVFEERTALGWEAALQR